VLGIHPDTIGFYERYARGERILWLAPMSYLFCFSREYRGHPDEMIWDWCPWGIEVAYPFDEHGRWSKDRLVALKFDSFAGQLSERDLLGSRDEEGRISALAVYDDIVAYCAGRGTQVNERYRAILASARAFLETERFLIPKDVWMRALPKTRN
jgi:hypothetical protein